MKIAQMNSPTSSHLTKTCLGAGNNSMAMDETIDAEVFGLCKFEPPLRDLALKLMHCEGQWFELRSRHDLDVFLAGFFVHLTGAGLHFV